MKTLTSKVLISLTTALLLSACSMTGTSPEEKGQITKEQLTQKNVAKLITKTAEKNGWRITPFRYNALVAEKIGDASTSAVTITFSTDSFELFPANSDLQNILSEALN